MLKNKRGNFISFMIVTILSIGLFTGCTQEQQNTMSRGIQNWTGTNGVLDVYAGEKLVMRFIKVDKMTTGGVGSTDGINRNYRYAYGYFDENQNFKVDPGEKKIYFEITDYSTYVFYENYIN